MKGYKFKLQALLKIRKLKEETCKMEIGQVQVKITSLQNQIKEHNQSIKGAFKDQEEALEGGLFGHELRFHPYFVEGKRSKIGLIKEEIKKLEEKKNEKLKELATLRANVKVLEKMKEKDQYNYKRKIEKKMNQEIEEQVQNWRQVLGK